MGFEAFAKGSTGGVHRQRCALSLSAAACLLVGIGVASAKVGGKPEEKPQQDDLVDVTFVEEIPEATPKEPPPPVAAPVLAVPESIKVSGAPPPPPAAVPTAIPKGKLDEADPSKDQGVAGSREGEASGSPTGVASATGAPVTPVEAAPPAPPPPPPPPPKPAGPQMVSEDDTPATPLSTPAPAYPEAARSAGIMGAVVVRLSIDEGGSVVDAKIVKSDPTFDDAVLATVRSWNFEPAKHKDGTPFRSTKTMKIPFKIKS